MKNFQVSGRVSLPSSKSISNRVLLIRALSDSDLPVENLSDCDDTRAMLGVLSSCGNRFDVGHAGTAMRFLTAFLAGTVGTWVLDGSERMRQRPIAPLVDALNRLGADISYLGQEGFPPLRIRGACLRGGRIAVPASLSSQYISALMLVAPYMDGGLEISLEGRVVSSAYIRMTAGIMRDFGVEVEVGDRLVRVAPGEYDASLPYVVEADWSAASYFLELMAVAKGGELFLPGLKQESRQGDAAQLSLWRRMGVESRFTDGGLLLTKGCAEEGCLTYDFLDMPDLLPSFAVACCLQGRPFRFSGLYTLRIKETDRLSAMVQEAAGLGCLLKTEGDGVLCWDGERTDVGERPVIGTHGDHRMAMAFAPALACCPGLEITGREVVSKSFPAFWHEFGKALPEGIGTF